MKIEDLFKKPCIISIIADVDEGKSNLVYYILEELNKKFKCNLYAYGLRNDVKFINEINSIQELETIKDSIIFLDEFMSLINLDDRNQKKEIENTLRLIFHNNNILVLIGLPENFKKFISSKVKIFIYKRVTFADFINGSTAKKRILDYHGLERGSTVLNLNKGEAIIHNKSYTKIKIPYLKKYDTKKNNKNILERIKKSKKKY